MIFPALLTSAVALGLNGALLGATASQISATCGLSVSTFCYLLSTSQIFSLAAFTRHPAWLSRFGHYRTLLVTLTGTIASSLLITQSHSAVSLLVPLILLNVSTFHFSASLFPVTIYEKSSGSERRMSLVHMVFAISSLLSGFYISYVKETGWQKGYLLIALLWSVILTLLLVSIPRARKIEKAWVPAKKRNSLLTSFEMLRKKDYRIFFISLATAASMEGLITLYPILFVENRFSADAKSVGMCITCFYTGYTISRVTLSVIVTKIRKKREMLILAISLVCALMGAFTFARTLTQAVFILTLAGIPFGIINPLYQLFAIQRWTGHTDALMNLHSISSGAGRVFWTAALGLILNVSTLWALRGFALALGLSLCLLIISTRR